MTTAVRPLRTKWGIVVVTERDNTGDRSILYVGSTMRRQIIVINNYAKPD